MLFGTQGTRRIDEFGVLPDGMVLNIYCISFFERPFRFSDASIRLVVKNTVA